MEVIKPLSGYEGLYKISSYGYIISVRNKNPRILKGSNAGSGYRKIILVDRDGNRSHKYIHRLVANEFMENNENLPVVNHKNGIKDDNRIENLEWCTHQYNHQHASDTGIVKKKGVNNPMSKLCKNDVLEIRSCYEQGFFSQYDLAKAYNVAVMTINRIVNNKTWKHI